MKPKNLRFGVSGPVPFNMGGEMGGEGMIRLPGRATDPLSVASCVVLSDIYEKWIPSTRVDRIRVGRDRRRFVGMAVH
jgi:hypothetical protein